MRPPATLATLSILGPTASGKSALALAVAERLDGEIVSCDSLQVYRDMDIGTGKVSADERRRVPHHLLDVVSPDQPFHAARWAELARAAIADITARGRTPIVCGGTGLYFRALTRGLFDAPAPDPALRARHKEEAVAIGVPALHARLAAVDPEAASAISPQDLVRVSRALEVYEQTGLPISELRRRAAGRVDLAACTVVLDPPIPRLRELVAARVAAMMRAGFLDEVRALRAAGYGGARPMQALGYKELGAHLAGELDLDEAVVCTVSSTVAYARRQRTWFRKEPALLRPISVPAPEEVVAAWSAWLRGGAKQGGS